ncbi:MAG: glycosyltransferase [Acidimicrobiales bacterium]
MTTAYVATRGGHISELLTLADRIGGDDELWITSDHPQTRDLLDGRHAVFVPPVGERDLAGVLRTIPIAIRLLTAHRVTRVISTGSALALGYLPVAAARGLDVHYIESSTRVHSCSVTGRLLCRIPSIQCWWQYPEPPPRFRYAGGVYDEFVPSLNPQPSDLQRIVVTVGTTHWDFRRLIARLVNIVPAGAEVLWQTGRTDVSGLDIDANEVVPESVLVDAIEQADVVISHAGAGSLALALQAGKIPVFVPRRVGHGEQIDDHQVELARWADQNSLAVTVEADQIQRHHLADAAGRRARRTPVEDLVLR